MGKVLQLADLGGMALMLLRVRARRVYAHEERVPAAILIPHRVSASFRFVLALLWTGMALALGVVPVAITTEDESCEVLGTGLAVRPTHHRLLGLLGEDGGTRSSPSTEFAETMHAI